MKRIFQLGLIAVFALLLSACEITVTFDPFPNAAQVSATTSPTDSQTVTLAANESEVFEVLLDSSVQSNQALYFELDTLDVEMVVYTSDGTALASSTSDSVFELGTRATSSAVVASQLTSEELTPQIVTPRSCRGTCVIRNANASKFYLRLTNPTSTDRSFELFLYSEAYGDGYEPANDTESGGVGMSTGDVEEGAIEDLGDQDYWLMNDSGDLFFDASAQRPSVLELRLQVYESDGTPVGSPQEPGGGAIRVFAGDTVKVFELDNDAAGPADTSLYFLELQ